MDIPLNPHTTYTAPSGRPFRVVSVEIMRGTERWIEKKRKCWTRIGIKYLDKQGGKANLIYDYYDKLKKVEKL